MTFPPMSRRDPSVQTHDEPLRVDDRIVVTFSRGIDIDRFERGRVVGIHHDGHVDVLFDSGAFVPHARAGRFRRLSIIDDLAGLA